ncbi:MAG: hypothetical protein H6555_11155 [Lewinellaceae bacterium]|nr:hypothetical protein [Lewinellaceae bacterium]
MADQSSIFERAFNPVFQALITFGGVVVVTIVSVLVKATGLISVPERFPWMAAAAFMLCYAMFNSVFSLSAPNMAKYWGTSIYSFMGLAIASGFSAYLFSSLTIGEAGSYRWIYVVVTFGYLVFLGMMAFLKNIVQFAQREEWTQPRIRQRKRK